MRRLPAVLAAVLGTAPPVAAAELRVGPGERFASPSAAAAVARAGDRVVIRGGHYRDCAIWQAPDVTITADGGEVVIFGPVCGGKALLVAAAPRLTVVGLTFRGAVAPPGNGAGIRAEGGDLTVRRSRFEANQNGILTAYMPTAALRIEDSVFIGNGALEQGRACAHGLYAGDLALVAIHRSRFEATRICHHVKSRAQRTEIVETTILDGAETRSSYLVDVPNGGDLLLARSVLRKGPNAGNPSIAVAIGAEGVRHPTRSLRIEDNSFTNLLPGPTAFVRNWSEVPARLAGNRLHGPVTPLLGPGSVE